jgi:HTH-type transcriptional regulator / antitoxin HigA
MEQPAARSQKGTRTPEEETLYGLLSVLIREYDDREYPVPAVDPIQTLQYLMAQHALRTIDLTPIFGARSIASLVLSGKREVSKTHIRKLAEFFHVRRHRS